MARRKKADKDNYYIDPEELKQSIIEMQEIGHMTDRFARHLLLIQEKVLKFPRYRGYTQEIKDEMRSHNVQRWVKNGWKTIDPNKNPFAYITQGCYLNFLQAVTNYFRQFNKMRDFMKEIYEMKGLDWRDSPYEEAERQEALNAGKEDLP